jgi:O-antigen ligase
MWHSSLAFVKDAPILGHGTGSIEKLFGQAQAAGESALVTRNPHQQIIAVAIQLGLVGVGIMFAMWIAHFLLFRGRGLAAWCGTIVVVQTVVSSVFNSYMFDFGSGWSYVWAVGVLGGTVLKKTIDHWNCLRRARPITAPAGGVGRPGRRRISPADKK